MLTVEVSDQVVILRGCASCYYLAQLAIQGTLDVIGSNGDRRIELNMQVVGAGGSRRAVMGANCSEVFPVPRMDES